MSAPIPRDQSTRFFFIEFMPSLRFVVFVAAVLVSLHSTQASQHKLCAGASACSRSPLQPGVSRLQGGDGAAGGPRSGGSYLHGALPSLARTRALASRQNFARQFAQIRPRCCFVFFSAIYACARLQNQK